MDNEIIVSFHTSSGNSYFTSAGAVQTQINPVSVVEALTPFDELDQNRFQRFEREKVQQNINNFLHQAYKC